MGITLGIILVLAALAVVVYPFVIVRRRWVSAPNPAAQRLRAARTRTYRQIDELDSELKSGEIGEEEHQKQVDELRMAAARILREMSMLESGTASEAELEREIAEARRERSSTVSEPEATVVEPELDR